MRDFSDDVLVRFGSDQLTTRFIIISNYIRLLMGYRNDLSTMIIDLMGNLMGTNDDEVYASAYTWMSEFTVRCSDVSVGFIRYRPTEEDANDEHIVLLHEPYTYIPNK